MRKLATTFMTLILACTTALSQVNYTIPFPRPLSEADDTVSVFIIGDVMMHSKQLLYNHETFLENIAPQMQEADFCIANMEFPLGGEPYTGYPAFSTPDWYADYVADCGANVFLMANNHVLDKGAAGLERTLRIYRKMEAERDVRHTGTGGTPLIVRKGSIRIALVNFTYGTNSGSAETGEKVNRMREEEVERMMKKAAESKPDFIVALPHWGEEYSLTHSASQEKWAKKLVELGADVVVGSHPHVVQDTTHIDGVPVIYSVGNAVSNMSARNTRLELAVTLRFVSDLDSGNKWMLEPKLEFMWCTLPGMLIDSYSTIMVKEWADRRSDWLTPSDYDNMIETLRRVKASTGIVD